MKLLSHISFDFLSPGITPRIYGKQDDSGSRVVAISLYSSGVAVAIPDNAVLAIRYRCPSGAIGLYDTTPDGVSAFSIDGNTVYCTLIDQIFAVPGRVSAELRIVDREGSATTWEFYIEVVPSKTGDSTLPTDYVNVFADLARRAEAAAERVESQAGMTVTEKIASADHILLYMAQNMLVVQLLMNVTIPANETNTSISVDGLPRPAINGSLIIASADGRGQPTYMYASVNTLGVLAGTVVSESRTIDQTVVFTVTYIAAEGT